MAKNLVDPARPIKARTVAAAGVGVAAAMAGIVGAGLWFEGVWAGEPYPVADPAATSRSLDERTQTVYDALALPDARLDTERSGVGAEAEGYGCNRRGVRHWADGFSGSPPSEPGVVNVSYDWTLRGVPRARAVAALKHAKKELTREGWKVASHDNDRFWLRLKMVPPGGDASVSVTSYPAGRLEIAGYADCARYPEGTPLDEWGDPELAEMRAPVQLRD
ncbi:hypothetical protein ABT390_04825 [Streptomyces aurantiacus]|uniref:hypothetical protein n=1 Tax=Streptomyces aurantiacus TaxID=47760 RepID=UPI00055D4FD3|nr:hypothetical protein [Streptomyces aurantiacus]